MRTTKYRQRMRTTPTRDPPEATLDIHVIRRRGGKGKYAGHTAILTDGKRGDALD